jgi:hypothetical protein
MTVTEAIDWLNEAGAVNEKKENSHGETLAGWWMDDVFLARDPKQAVREAKGNA